MAEREYGPVAMELATRSLNKGEPGAANVHQRQRPATTTGHQHGRQASTGRHETSTEAGQRQ